MLSEENIPNNFLSPIKKKLTSVIKINKNNNFLYKYKKYF